MSGSGLAWQPSLFERESIKVDTSFTDLAHSDLGSGAWVEYVPNWVEGAGKLFEDLLDAAEWRSRVVHMYERKLREPRLTSRWELEGGEVPLPVLGEIAQVLGERYAVRFTSVGCNLYRNGSDSVAWHGDRVARDLP
ncbi:MAG: alpha-ketoglutarate-dependent dioxygenase AlkB, partial [Actinomycetota bacterium]|nr:alpha-ketoglutarate-dependent dioxygenase AlkB [Actinomycetota bacterium]